MNPLTLVREDRRAVFAIPLQQDTDGAQGILSPGTATDLVVLVHLSVDVLRKQVSLSVSTVVGG